MQSTHPIDAEKELVAAFFSEPLADRHSANSTFDLDFSVINRAFLDGLTETGQPSHAADRLLLPPNYVWSRNGKTRAPMALCEFVAYKAALAYKDETTVRANAGKVEQLQFFDTSKDGVSDTQGFAFMYDGMAFVIMRGTEKKSDWKINLQHQFTDELQAPKRQKKKLVGQLKSRHGDHVEPLLDALASKPGRHLGFAIGWAAVHDKISAHLKACCPNVPVVLGGHSLGGALALVGAMELSEGHDIAAVVTFGAPQAGNDAFSQEYAAKKLRERTVQFEAQGDSVPRVMRRWYYRLHRSLRERIDRFATSNAMPVPRSQYAVAGTPWTFSAQPALSANEVAGAIRAIIDARDRKAKEEEERKSKEATPPVATAAPEPDAGVASTAAPTPAQAPASAPERGSTDGKVAWLIVGGILGLFLLLFLWLFVRSKLSAHAVIDRYALFLSTLSYQRIRALRAVEPGTAAERLNLANGDLSRYMRFIRADVGGDSYIAKAKAADLPVRLRADLDLKTFLSDPKNII